MNNHLTPNTSSFPPGPPPITNLFGLLRFIRQINKDMLGTFKTWFDQYGDIFVMRFYNMQRFLITRPEAIHEVAVTKANKFYKDIDYKDTQKGLARFLGNGLLISDGDFWKRQRRLVAPALHTKRIENYAETMVNFALKMLENWWDAALLDISREMTNLTMNIVALTLFNVDVSGEAERVGRAIDAMQEASGTPSLLPAWIPTPMEMRARRARRDLDQIIYGIINQRRATREDKGDLLSMLLLTEDEDGNRMTDLQARDEAVTLFLAGHETTANALNWTWYLLAQHPQVEAKLHQELDTVLAGQPPTLADLKRLPYTEMVIKESMRLYPPAWGFSREAIEDVEIGGYFVPKGSIVGVMSYFTHRDPRWWEEPEAFKPERFSPENEPNIPKYAYLPFGAGPRICIGNAFAMMEAQLILATVASRFRLTLAPGQEVEMLPLITLNPKGGLPMTVKQRESIRELVVE
jgi:cytochrome P450